MSVLARLFTWPRDFRYGGWRSAWRWVRYGEPADWND